MKRRDFVKGLAATSTLPFWLQGCKYLDQNDYPIHVRSDHGTGHLLMESTNWPEVKGRDSEIAIIGGGIAGLAAAYSLRNADYQLFELSDRMGGTSAAIPGLNIAQGAHYELAYPENYGTEVLLMLEELQVIKYERWKNMWSFTDSRHIIPFERRDRCYENGSYRKEVIQPGKTKDQFYELINEFKEKMPLPTRLISNEHRHLNDLSLLEYLNQEMEVDERFVQQLDYHMMDDWGGKTEQVSALAGIHYFACRPYLEKSVDLFSPPQGNAYFAEKIQARLSTSKTKTSHLVSKIDESGDSFELVVLDVLNKKRIRTKADKVVYAGQKHALKYIYPKEADLFDLKQAPWMVLNFITDQPTGQYGHWQNEFLGTNRAFMGFIDSSVQDRKSLGDKRVLTAYYCLKPQDREYLTTIPENAENIASETLGYIAEALGNPPDIQSCHINVMGHAMAIPIPGFLFNDANDKNPDLIYAGVDNGRLPLLYEALDSGLMAGKLI